MRYDFSKERLPKVYRVNGAKYYQDPIRQKKVMVHPKERVRQQVISYLLDKLNVPKEMIKVEEPLSNYCDNSRFIADIIILRHIESMDRTVPLCMIGCKAPGVRLDEYEINLMLRDSNYIGSNFIMLTNGNSMICYRFNPDYDIYEEIPSLPLYINQINEEYFPPTDQIPLTRCNHDELPDKISEYIYEGLIGESTPPKLVVPMMNLSDSLYFSKEVIPARKYKLFTMIGDCGIRYLRFGDASGGFFESEYRSFKIRYANRVLIVSFAVSTYCTQAHPDVIQTVLNVGIEDESRKISHHSLELVADNYLSVERNTVFFNHTGRIAISNIGSGRIDELRELVSQMYPKIISGKQFCLGSLVDDHNWTLDEPDMVELFENLISYALIRDEYRLQVLRRKKGEQ